MSTNPRWPTHPKAPTLGWLGRMAKIGRVFNREHGFFVRSPYKNEWHVFVSVGERHQMRVAFTAEEMLNIPVECLHSLLKERSDP